MISSIDLIMNILIKCKYTEITMIIRRCIDVFRGLNTSPVFLLMIVWGWWGPANTMLYGQNDSVEHRMILQGIEITAEKNHSMLKGSMEGKLDLDIRNMQNLPQFMGNVDLVRTMQLTPGIQTAGEMNSGLYIRGGEAGHNSFRINGATIYNPAHLMGFFSVFNSMHVDRATIMKSYIPAENGGQISALIDVDCRPELINDSDRVEGQVGVGLLSTQTGIKFRTGKNGVMGIAARKTYINTIMKSILKAKRDMGPEYSFEDYNATYRVMPDNRNEVIFNAYFGRDLLWMKNYMYQAQGGTKWMNGAVSAEWCHRQENNRKVEYLKWKNRLTFSYYRNRIETYFGQGTLRMESRIADVGYKGGTEFVWKDISWSAGADMTRHGVIPQAPTTNTIYGDTPNTVDNKEMRMIVAGGYVEGRKDLNEFITLSMGLRMSGEITLMKGGPEPRMMMEYKPDAQTRLSAVYTMQRQYMNMVSVSGIGLPTDFRLPVSEYVDPQVSNNFSAGFTKTFQDKGLELNTEVYFRKYNNQLEFDGQMIDLVNEVYRVEEHLNYGKGWSYGLEVMLKMNRRNFNGWISYTLGKAERKFSNINNGRAFPAKNDRRHDLSVVGVYKWNEKWDFSAVYVLATGNTFTMPKSVYMLGENFVCEYGPYNGSRMPLYHRMDVSANCKLDKNGRHNLNLSIYNCYGRKNPYMVVIDVKFKNEDKEHVKISPKGLALYDLLPSIGYNFKF